MPGVYSGGRCASELGLVGTRLGTGAREFKGRQQMRKRSEVELLDRWMGCVFAHRKGSVYKTGYGETGGKEVAFSWDQGPTRV